MSHPGVTGSPGGHIQERTSSTHHMVHVTSTCIYSIHVYIFYLRFCFLIVCYSVYTSEADKLKKISLFTIHDRN